MALWFIVNRLVYGVLAHSFCFGRYQYLGLSKFSQALWDSWAAAGVLPHQETYSHIYALLFLRHVLTSPWTFLFCRPPTLPPCTRRWQLLSNASSSRLLHFLIFTYGKSAAASGKMVVAATSLQQDVNTSKQALISSVCSCCSDLDFCNPRKNEEEWRQVCNSILWHAQ